MRDISITVLDKILIGIAKRLYSFGIAREKIVDALAYAPYRRLNLKAPELVPGEKANVIIMDEDMRMTDVFSYGHKVREEKTEWISAT